jgi:AraC-like DNA-binding protein
VVEIASAAGFPDLSHFTKTFRYQLGIKPGEYHRYFRALSRDHGMFRRDKTAQAFWCENGWNNQREPTAGPF